MYDITGEDMPIKTRQHWSQIEAGEKNFSVTTLFKVAMTLEVSVETIIKDILLK